MLPSVLDNKIEIGAKATVSNEDHHELGKSSPVLRFLLWLASGLVLAVLGSALWDFIFRSAFIWAGERLVDLTTFGSAALIDSMYKEIAKGNYERASVFRFRILAGSLVIAPSNVVAWSSRNFSTVRG